MLLMAAEEGNSRRLTCPYHGWTYDTKGILRVVPDEADFIHGSPCGKANLVEIPCETWAGFVWYNMDPDCISLRSSMQPIADQIDTYPMDDMVRTHWVTLEGDFNWKLVQDNFNESYHVPFVHPQTKFVMEYAYDNSQFDLYPSGHCRMLMPGATPTKTLQGGEDETLSYLDNELKFWGLDPDLFRGGKTGDIRLAMQRQKRLLGAEKGYDFSTYHDAQLTDHWHFTIFPNLSFSLKPDGNIWLRARPHETDPEKAYFDMWYMTLFPKGQTQYYSQSMAEWVDVSVPSAAPAGQARRGLHGPRYRSGSGGVVRLAKGAALTRLQARIPGPPGTPRAVLPPEPRRAVGGLKTPLPLGEVEMVSKRTSPGSRRCGGLRRWRPGPTPVAGRRLRPCSPSFLPRAAGPRCRVR